MFSYSLSYAVYESYFVSEVLVFENFDSNNIALKVAQLWPNPFCIFYAVQMDPAGSLQPI